MTMPNHSLSSRVLRAFGRLLRRLTIGLGALILAFHYFGDWILAVWPYPACSEWPKSRLANHLESQVIHKNQYLSGRTLRTQLKINKLEQVFEKVGSVLI